MPRSRYGHGHLLDDEQVAAVVEAVRAVEQYYGYPVDVEWVLDRHRRQGEPVCVVQARPVTVERPGTPIRKAEIRPKGPTNSSLSWTVNH
jgi:phosphoenolpyruvate synthase/pyruvate phosphate dikinase